MMLSTGLLNDLEQIPLEREHDQYTLGQILRESARMRNGLFAIEAAAAAELSMSALFDARNVPDDLMEAYRLAAPNVASEHDLHERYLEMVEQGPDKVTGFVNNIKGKLAELRVVDQLEQEYPGFSFELADAQNQAGWDILMTGPDGSESLIQVKVGDVDYAQDVVAQMQDNPDVLFAVSDEIHSKIVEAYPELAPQLMEVDLSGYELTGAVHQDLELLADNFGIDVPDGLGGILPYVTEIVLGIRFLIDVIHVERQFKTVDVHDRRRIHAMKAILLFSRFGVTAVCSSLGGALGTNLLPGAGTVLGGLGGVGVAVYLNRKLQPYIVEIAMWLLRVSEDDMFYYRNKSRIDKVGLSLARTAEALSA